MPITPSNYSNPGWTNNAPPALNAANLNAISDAIVLNQSNIAVLDAEKLNTNGKGINRLVNWYFVGGGTDGMLPVNQRGSTGANAYTTAGAYTIDRWSFPSWSSAHAMSVWSNGIQVNGLLAQYLNASAGLNGYTVTASILFISGGTGSKVALVAYTPSAPSGYVAAEGNVVASEGGISIATLAIPTDATNIEFRIDCSSSVGSVIAAKLEEGSIQTLARLESGAWVLNDLPPVYSEELHKCQYYYWRKQFIPRETIALGVAVQTWGAVVIQLGVARQMNQNAFTSVDPSRAGKVLCTITPLNGGGIGFSSPVALTGFQNQSYCSQNGSTVMYQTTATITAGGEFYAYANDSVGLIIEVDAEQR